MKYFIYNCLFLVIILFFAYINTKNQQEAFTPKIRELYRPHVRNARIYSEGLYNNHSANISNLFRKFGIM
jgi:abortive infection bacteriophage resistance protein